MAKSLKILHELPAAETQAAKEFKGRVALITLGCAKNQVDSEVMLGALKRSGFEIVSAVDKADVAVINTCGFLESAVKESIDCILDVSELKRTGSLRKLIVAGCMVSRYKGDLRQTMPEVDCFVSSNEILNVPELADNKLRDLIDQGGRPYFLYDDTMPRVLSSKRHSAYVKVGEGCDRPCSFCIIPQIRGPMRSRTIDSVVREVNHLAQMGVKEVNLVAQDLTSYGRDRGRSELNELLTALENANSVPWIRLLYAYPIGIDEDLLKTIRNLKNICNYLDLPLQHSSERILRAMKRPLGNYAPRIIAPKISESGIELRTTFIVGFPGETEEDIADLESFIAEGHFHHVGVFTYSKEQGTSAAELSNQISEEEKELRRQRLMLAQQKVVTRRLSALVGTELKVLIEGTHPDSDLLISARAHFQAPEVDGTVIINDVEGDQFVEEGIFGTVKVTGFEGYDLLGTLVEPPFGKECDKVANARLNQAQFDSRQVPSQIKDPIS